MGNEIDLTVQCRKNLNSSPRECMFGVTYASFKLIDDVLQSVSKMLDEHYFKWMLVENLKYIKPCAREH